MLWQLLCAATSFALSYTPHYPAGQQLFLICSTEEGAVAQFLVNRELTEEGPRRLDGVRPGTGSAAVRSVRVNLAESPLTWLHARGHLNDRQFAAGERLRADWERAELAPSVTMRWDAVRIGGGEPGLTQSERQLAARRRFDGAIAAAGPGLEPVSAALALPGRGPLTCRRREALEEQVAVAAARAPPSTAAPPPRSRRRRA